MQEDNEVIDGKVPGDTVKRWKTYLIAKDTKIYQQEGNHRNQTVQHAPRVQDLDRGAGLPDPQVFHGDFSVRERSVWPEDVLGSQLHFLPLRLCPLAHG